MRSEFTRIDMHAAFADFFRLVANKQRLTRIENICEQMLL